MDIGEGIKKLYEDYTAPLTAFGTDLITVSSLKPIRYISLENFALAIEEARSMGYGQGLSAGISSILHEGGY